MSTVQPPRADWPESDELNQFLEPRAQERVPWLLAFFCLIFTTLPSYLVSPVPFASIASPGRILGLVFFSLTVLGFLLIPRHSIAPTINPGVILLVIYLLITIAVWGIGISHVGTASQEASKATAVVAWFAPVGLGLYTLRRVVTIKQRSIILGCLVVGVTYSGVVGLVQHITQINLADLLQPPGFHNNQTDGTVKGLISKLTERAGATRAYGTFVHAIPFSVSCAAVVPLALHFARYATSRKIRALATIATVVLFLAVPAGVARSGLIALAVALVVYARTFTLRQLCSAVVAFAFVFVVYIIAVPNTAQALYQTIINSGEDQSVLVRIGPQYDLMVDTFRAHPISGVGLGAVTIEDYGVVDNQWLSVMAEGGILGLVALTALAAGGVFGITAALRQTASARDRDQVYAMAAAFLAILVNSTTFKLFGFEQTLFLFFLLFALLWSNCTEQGVAMPMSGTLR
jgi:hypothetical protein